MESASPIRPLKVYFEVFPTPKQSEPGVERRALMLISAIFLNLAMLFSNLAIAILCNIKINLAHSPNILLKM